MQVQNALEKLQDEQVISVKGRAFQPIEVDKMVLPTNEVQFWIKSDDGVWLSIDQETEEIRLFEELNEALEPVDGSIFYAGEDYELSYEENAKVVDEYDERIDGLVIREYESDKGDVLRFMESEISGDISLTLGRTITEEDLQDV